MSFLGRPAESSSGLLVPSVWRDRRLFTSYLRYEGLSRFDRNLVAADVSNHVGGCRSVTND
jgi:hypothetical protein